jgi:hypothetical protein
MRSERPHNNRIHRVNLLSDAKSAALLSGRLLRAIVFTDGAASAPDAGA